MTDASTTSPSPVRRQRAAFRRAVLGSATLALLALLISPFVGERLLGIDAVLAGPGAFPDGVIFWELRLPRVLMGWLAGAALALAGAGFQALLRNPLATPYTLGVASGASLGAVLAVLTGATLWLPHGLGLSVSAFLGAGGSVAVVYLLARRAGRLGGLTLILAGVTLSFFCGALVLFAQYLADPMQMVRMLRWMVGGLEPAGLLPALRAAPFVLALAWVLLRSAADLNLMSAGDELAAARGVEVERVRARLFLAASLATGAVVAEAGPIGFVGLIVPHAVRLRFGPDHRILVPTSAFAGAAFLTACDALARALPLQIEVPVGVITALLGGPFFLWLLRRR